MVEAQVNFNPFDGMVFTILFVSAIISVFRGFIREFLSLATWVGAGLITLALADDSARFLSNYFDNKMGAAIFGALGTYFLVLITLGSLSRLLVRYVRDGTEVGWVDNVMGLLFGLFKGGLIIVLGFIMMTLVFREDGYPDWVRNAYTLPAVRDASIKVVRMMPEYLGSISMLDQPGEPAALAGDNAVAPDGTPLPQDTMESGLERELLPEGLVDDTQKRDANALERLIQDVTDKRPETDDRIDSLNEGQSGW